MITIGKKMLSFLLLILIATAPFACININKSPDDRPKTEVNVGGEHGITVEHDNNDK